MSVLVILSFWVFNAFFCRWYISSASNTTASLHFIRATEDWGERHRHIFKNTDAYVHVYLLEYKSESLFCLCNAEWNGLL